ncbi:hypothetical protein HA464_06095 [Rhizobium leguminosarum bv. trifolii]|uniref:hypothetical protein n=1 Tax=Rhizobium ruizarguesonis TaxID=2081791 RepID=UPI000373C09A|nr:hypothetical protein [Rhizobium ruizarguesonis]MBY5831368.1 hypothetical protein [Rhizobium leguminosarum]QIO43621.1 hypothetical protein HA464_06095 [Rhizobium leguminosarum bv. trifolii]QJS27588.1 hypothetical protein RLTA1_09970 [Rhizobium leguminosarum bv. trifolii TA1]QND20306.1 hypothetical protein HB774_09345 [Rhizobium leguminosarum bv. viciae]MBY5859770.1 hypothetical protein [Rhizobium leguminosarum]
MDETPKTAIRGMIFYVLALLVLGVLAGAVYTIYGHPADPSEQPAAETIPQKAPAPQ